MKSHQQFSLQKNNSFAVAASAPIIYYPTNEQELQSLSVMTHDNFYILGEGSNTLFVEESTPAIIKPEFFGIRVDEFQDCYLVHAACGENWHRLVVFCIEQGIYGLENLALIPGSVGAAPVQNIGAYGVEVADFIDSVTWFDFTENESLQLTNNQCQFSYRNSIFKQSLKNKGVITHITLRFPKQWQAKLSYQGLNTLAKNSQAKDVMAAVIAIRQSKLPDPSLIPNAGSFFKNPVVSEKEFSSLSAIYPEIPHYPQEGGTIKLAAGWLIEKSGLKGYEENGAGVHSQQALVLTNVNTAQGADIKNLAQHVQNKVFEKFTIKLTPEVRIISAHGEISLEESC